MISNNYFQIVTSVYMLLLAIVFFSKKRLESIENKILGALIIINSVGLILDISSTYLAHVDVTNVILNPLCKIYLLYLIIKCLMFTVYVYFVSIVKEDTSLINRKIIFRKSLIFIGLLFVIVAIIIFKIPLYNVSENGLIYTHGPAATITYGVVGVCTIIWILSLIKNFRNIKDKKYLPIFVLIFFIISIALLQYIHPELLIVTSMCSFITFMMFFTIENPDVKLIKELDIAREQAEKANLAKTDFLSNMSHEIRTPLNAIVGFSQSLSERELESDAADDVKDIMIASESLLDIVNGVLDISKIEANKLEIVNKEYNMEEVFGELEALIRGRLGDKPIEFRTKFDPSIPRVLYGDYVRIKQIIINILTNSVKYTKDGFIDFHVNCYTKGNYCRLIISVEDSGIGIKKENIDKLFNKFERVDLEENISIEGTGLGLAITKRLVELMNGQIVVQSVYGQGSKFTIAINQRIVKNPTIVTEKFEEVDFSTIDYSDKRVLVVDDNKINLKVAKRLLEQYKVNVVDVYSGFECIDLINNSEQFDLILLDDMMPKLTGVETLKRLKEKEGFNIPTVALTANALTGMREKYLSEGFDDYLAKPINRDELTKVISKFLSKK